MQGECPRAGVIKKNRGSVNGLGGVLDMASDEGQGCVKGERGSVKEKGACERAGAVSSVGC